MTATKNHTVLTEAPPGTARPDSSSTAPDPRRWWALVVLATAQLMIVLDASIINIALPSAQHALHISNVDREWVITAYTLSFGGLLLLGGRVADYLGRKRIFVIGLIGFAVASALGGLATNEATLFGARALQGAFGAVLAPAALSLISVTFHKPRERATAFAVYGGVSGGGAAVGLVMGGLLTEYASWRWCLLVNVPIAAVAAVAGSVIIRESRSTGDRHYDIPGAVLSTLGLASVVYGFSEAAKAGVGWSSPTTISIIGIGVLLLIAFAAVEQRVDHPLLPMRVVLERNRAGAFLANFFAWAGLFAMFLFLAYYFQQNLGYSPVTSGLAFLPFSAGVAVTAGATPKLLPVLGARVLMIAGTLLGAVGLAYLTRIGADTGFVSHVLPAEVVLSVGTGLLLTAQSGLALHGVLEHDAGVASAMLNTTQQIGGALGIALLNTLFTSAAGNYAASHRGHGTVSAVMSAASIHGYRVTFVVGALMLVAALVVVVVLVNASKSELSREELPEVLPAS